MEVDKISELIDMRIDEKIIKTIDVVNIEKELDEKHIGRITRFEQEGINDGVLNLPHYEDELAAPTEKEIKNSYQADVNHLEEIGRPLLDEPNAIVKNLTDKLEQITPGIEAIQEKAFARMTKSREEKIEKLNSEHAIEIYNIEEEGRPIRNRWQQAIEHWDEIKIRFGRNKPVITTVRLKNGESSFEAHIISPKVLS